MQNYKMIVAYDGGRYKGWQRLKKEETVQGKIESVLSRMTEEAILIQGSGRTDAGVHARHQVVSFKLEKALNPDKMKHDLNRFLPEDIVILDLEEAPDRFHARFNAKEKTYTYYVWHGEVKPCLRRHQVGDYTGVNLDIDRMRYAAQFLTGQHDFKGLSSDKTKKSTVRTLTSIDFKEEKDCLVITFKGDGFLHNMVRIMVGSLVAIGKSELMIEDLETALKTGDRSLAGDTAPASGLFLSKVTY